MHMLMEMIKGELLCARFFKSFSGVFGHPDDRSVQHARRHADKSTVFAQTLSNHSDGIRRHIHSEILVYFGRHEQIRTSINSDNLI